MLTEDLKLQRQVTKTFCSLGTVIRLKLYGGDAAAAIEQVQKRIFEIDDKMSAYKYESEVSRINRKAGREAQEISGDTLYVIKKAHEYCCLSSGAFDPTIRPLVTLWGIGTEHARVPAREEIEGALALVGYRSIIIDEENHTAKLELPNQAIDLGSIAKGYAADEAAGILRKNGVESAILDLGGNIYALGNEPGGDKWKIGIQDPLGDRGSYVGVVRASDKAVVTSGNYERFFFQYGRRFHHILDPRTGYPCDSGLVSTTIISDLSIDGDALTTCIYVLGAVKGRELVESLPGITGIFITEDLKVLAATGQSQSQC